MHVSKSVLKFVTFFIFIITMLLLTGTTSVLIRNIFAGDDALHPFLLLIIYILIATASLNLHLKMSYETGNIKRAFFAVLTIVSGLTVIFTLRHILFEKAVTMEFTVLVMSFFLLLLSFLKFIEYSSKEIK